MEKTSKLLSIIENPDAYLSKKGKKLEDRLKGISIGSEEDKIIKNQTGKTIRDSLLGFIPFGQLANTIINWNESIDAEIENAKKNKILELYFQKTDDHDQSITQIRKLLTNPQGILFSIRYFRY